MENEAQLLSRRTADLRSLLEKMERIGGKEALDLLDEYVKGHEASLFQELGRLTRQVHDVLSSFHIDKHIIDITQHDIPDAKDRLNYVIHITEQAAQTVIDAIEGSIPLAAGMHSDAGHLTEKWQVFSRREMNVEEFRVLCRENETFLHSTQLHADRIREYLTEMLMAQELQDVTGQIIKRVIHLVQDVENSLVELVKVTGGRRDDFRTAAREEATAARGPAVPGIDHNRVNSQDDVDDLLSSLGF